MRVLGLILVHACAILPLVAAQERLLTLVSLQDSAREELARFTGEVGSNSNVTTPVEKRNDAPRLRLFIDAANELGCDNVTLPTSLPSEPFALVTRRGGCTFDVKADSAERYGASALLVGNTIEALYGTGANAAFLVNPCSTNCLLAKDQSIDACQNKCRTGICAANPRAISNNTEVGEYCCLENSLVRMAVGERDLLTVFVGVEDSGQLFQEAENGGFVQIFEDGRITVDGSFFLILFLGTLVTAFASYRAARKERLYVDWTWTPGKVPMNREEIDGSPESNVIDVDKEIETVELTVSAVICFLLVASASLIGLFYLATSYPQETVIALQVIFGLSALFAFSHFILQPIIRKLWPTSSQRKVYLPYRKTYIGNADEWIGFVIAVVVVIAWFVGRHQSWSWILLDLLAASICVLFLVAVRLPNLQLACLMLALFFVYDIFMVFISPALFGGRSVMVEVATAGGATANIDPEDNRVCDRTRAERMPMLFLVPRFSDDGYALLGLGDVFIPGLLMTYACRFDYLKVESLGKRTSWVVAHKYFFPLCTAYFVALLVTLIANVLDFNFSTKVEGQPALLYLVPATLGTFLTLAYVRGDLSDLWHLNFKELTEKRLQKEIHPNERRSESQEALNVVEAGPITPSQADNT